MTIPHIHRYRPPPALRLATRIHDLLIQRHTKGSALLLYPLDQLTGRLEQLASLRRRIALVQMKGWWHALAQLRSELQCLLRYLPGEVHSAEQAIPPAVTILSLAELAREFDQMDDEFGGWGYEAPNILLVATEPITLEEIPLGVFEIRLNLEHLCRLGSSPPYELIARTPNPAACNESVIHPHVRDGELCEGDAAIPIKAALSEGRLCDFFMLVRSVLQTYNPHSPHVALRNWHGSPCHDCNGLMEDGESFYCESCDHDFCDDCISYCRSCDESRCLGCLEDCPHCEERTCSPCMETCGDCGKPCCRNCLEEELCPKCLEKKNPQHKETVHDDSHPISTPQPAFAAAGGISRTSREDSDGESPSAGDGGGVSRLPIRARRRRRHRIPQAA